MIIYAFVGISKKTSCPFGVGDSYEEATENLKRILIEENKMGKYDLSSLVTGFVNYSPTVKGKYVLVTPKSARKIARVENQILLEVDKNSDLTPEEINFSAREIRALQKDFLVKHSNDF